MILMTKNPDHPWWSLENPLSFLVGHGGELPLPSNLGGWKLQHSFILTIQIDLEDKKNPDHSWKSQEHPLSFLGRHGGDGPLSSKLDGQELSHSFILTIQTDPEDKKSRSSLKESSLEDMEETEDFLII